MCGIFAYAQRGILSTEDKNVLDNYFNRIKHRGPDHTSSVVIESSEFTVMLGFHRLAIIDPSERSNELLRDGDVYMVCNGEIYNYQYLIKKYDLPVKTGSDCEVILQLYKHWKHCWPDIINEFDGVFSFVLYDRTTNELHVSRDRIGVRPLFVGKTSTELCYASEGKAVPLESVQPYQPGNYQIVKLNDNGHMDMLSTRWLKANNYSNVPYITAQTIIRELFTEAVRKRLVSDRPIGFLVSGGLDSSLVAAVAQRLLGQRITTFSIGLMGSPDLQAAQKVAKWLDSDHHEVIISPNDILEALPHVIYHNESYDITTTRASIPMYLIAKYIREHTDIKVIFSGEGADELLGGYLYFWKAPSYNAFKLESQRLVHELYKYDVLRSDRTTAAWGLELRVPFLDADFMNFIMNLDPAHKMPQTHTIEKAIMRRAFDGYLPDSVLYRQKEAFSDGIGYNSVASLKKYAESQSKRCDELVPNTAKPDTTEAHLYYFLFREHYAACPGLHTPYYWMPAWHDHVTDPSATVLENHNSSK